MVIVFTHKMALGEVLSSDMKAKNAGLTNVMLLLLLLLYMLRYD